MCEHYFKIFSTQFYSLSKTLPLVLEVFRMRLFSWPYLFSSILSVNRMWKRFLLCACVGLYIFGAAAQEYSMQMYYVKLIIEESATSNVSKINQFPQHFPNFNISRLQSTTDCELDDNEKRKSCECKEDHEWPQEACESESKCCGSNSCSTPNKYTCVSKARVIIYGSLTIELSFYHNCLAEITSSEFMACNNNLTETIKASYSTLDGFDSIVIKKYRAGSVIADFEVLIVSNVEPSIMQNKSITLISKLNGKMTMETVGVVRLSVPQEPVEKGTLVNITCSSNTSLQSKPVWELQNYRNETKDIHNGTESTIITTTYQSNVQLNFVSQLWTGQYSCSFTQIEGNFTITHKATKMMDVCVEPAIMMRTNPGFPRCTKTSDLRALKVLCEVEKTYESFVVSWEKQDIISVSPSTAYNDSEVLVFSAEIIVSCESTQPKLTCKLTNRCKKTVESTLEVIMIKEKDKYCKAEGDWQDTKAGYKAVMRCNNSVGNKTRPCGHDENWGQEDSGCVDLKLNSVLSNAKTLNTGLGKVENNTENVFTDLQSVTNNTKVINTPANLNTSISILKTMSENVERIDSEKTANDFLRSSSNLLDGSLDGSWEKGNQQSNHLAEKYLVSVEKLITKANVTKNNSPNLELVICKTSQCNSVFNNTVTITMPSTNTEVKTTGFLNLASHLSNTTSDLVPNSIVISVTTEPKTSSNVEVQIDFQLQQLRPRNAMLYCVYWDINSSSWSSSGCKWESGQNKGLCRCNHLSSFAILISKTKLKVPYLDTVTHVGLSVSIVSLIILLVVELIIWRDVVKTDTLHLRHCAHVNISVCLLVADMCFLSSSLSKELPDVWCQAFVVVQHFCYLAMFFWMLCLSSILLHKTVYVSLHGIGKTAYLRFSVIVGYVCPLLIVVITLLSNGGKEGQYYSKETRWLVYSGRFKGSIFTFILPMGIIVFVNVFLMCLVILKLLQPLKTQQMLQDKEKSSAKMVIRSVILLTPVFGVTWGFGFLVIVMDLTAGIHIYVANYIFTLLNAFQGLYIFLTTCVGDRMVREGLRKYFSKKKLSGSSFTTSVSMDQSQIKK